MGNVMNMPGGMTMRQYTQLDDGMWTMTESVLDDPLLYRRLVCTQIEELFALYQQYPLAEFEAVRQILSQMQRAYSDVAPFNHPMLAAMEVEDA